METSVQMVLRTQLSNRPSSRTDDHERWLSLDQRNVGRMALDKIRHYEHSEEHIIYWVEETFVQYTSERIGRGGLPYGRRLLVHTGL